MIMIKTQQERKVRLWFWLRPNKKGKWEN